jgi:hypothetical protein
MALTVEEIVMSGLCIGCGLCQAIRNPAMMDVSKRELNEFAGLLERTRRALELSTANQFCSTTGAVAELLQQ